MYGSHFGPWTYHRRANVCYWKFRLVIFDAHLYDVVFEPFVNLLLVGAVAATW